MTSASCRITDRRPAVTRETLKRRMLATMGLCYLGLVIAFVQDLNATDNRVQVIQGAAWVLPAR